MIRNLFQNNRRDISLAIFIVGVAGLGAVEQFCNILLLQIAVFPQIANTLVHNLTPVSKYILDYMQNKMLYLHYITNRYIMHIGGITMTNHYDYNDKFQKLLENDYEYISIQEDFREAEAAYLALYRKMPPQQQVVLTEFVGKLSELYLRQMELLTADHILK